MDYSTIPVEDLDYLAHYGILGMKWGVRRFQNSDGSLTYAGKVRYGKDSKGKKAEADKLRNTKVKDINHNVKSDEVLNALMLSLGGISAAALTAGIATGYLIAPPTTIAYLAVADATFAAGIGSEINSAIKQHKAKVRQENAEKDKKTGLPLKSEKLTAEEDCKLTNPSYSAFSLGGTNNCVLCSTAFELRRRGYDVTASRATQGYTDDEFEKFFKGCKMTYANNKTHNATFTAYSTPTESRDLARWAKKELLKQGNGARGYLSMISGNGAGHSLTYEVKDNKIVIYDSQIGQVKTIKDITDISCNISYCRLDDKEPNWAAMKAAGVI